MSPVRLFFIVVVGGGLGLVLFLDWLSRGEMDAEEEGGGIARLLWKLCVSASTAFLFLLLVVVIWHIVAD